MGNIFNQDFLDFILTLEKFDARYILVGGYSVILHGYPRTTGDLDIWVDQTKENYRLLIQAFSEFGLPMMSENEFLNPANEVFTYGRPPIAIDVMTTCKGLLFKEAFNNSQIINVDGISIRLIHYNDLIVTKKASGRYKDLNDIEHLEQ
ncbi:MAG: hypothetical protein MUE33_12480 [Cytophagaceae bacterium]|jgi:hypothetical protein|nr:hypothetical protein [Cytophagaceae bacterium]